MAPYDSDDSLDEDQDYTETNVLLGFASKEPSGETISKLGGRPDWIDPSNPPSYTSTFRCAACAAPLVLLLQLNAELASRFPGHERRLYVLACRGRACRRREGSVRAVRAVRVSADAVNKAREREERAEKDKVEKDRQVEERKEADKGLGEALFGVKSVFGSAGGNANPFSTAGGASSSPVNPFTKPASTSSSAENPFSPAGTIPAPEPENTPTATTYDLPKTFAAALSLTNPHPAPVPAPPPTPWPSESDLPPPYPVSYLAEADYETLDPHPHAAPPATSMDLDDDPATASGGGGGAGAEDKDVFESSLDATFQRFADRLAQNPDQCIRYEFGGAPLLSSRADAVGRALHDVPAAGVPRALPRCAHCGRGRVFEVQLTPRAIVELEEGDAAAAAGGGAGVLEGMDWGVVIVAVCEGDCVPGGTAGGEVVYVEEWVGVQWEELGGRR